MTRLEEILCLADARNLPDASPDGAPCCDAYAMFGPERCLCWERVHDINQQPIQRDQPLLTADSMCRDCAFRPGSPERRDSDKAVCSTDDLLRLADPTNPERFFCHRGMRATIGHYHPLFGVYVPHQPEDGVVAYDPPIRDSIAYQANGQPALLCAGLAAARRAKDWTP